MDDIYGELENYNDVNAIDELRNANKDLQCKVEKYESDIKKLQQKLDSVQSDYSKLQFNFSSLLKTAREEVQRKTLMIDKLNQEKDNMVLNSLKDCDKSLLNIRRNLLRNGYTKDKKNPGEPDTKKNESDISASVNTEKATFPAERDVGPRTSESKENLPHGKSKAQSIRQRRKTMPVLNKLPKFSSDDETDSVVESNKKDRPPEEKHKSSERIKQKLLETPGIEDKCSSNRESSRETHYRNRCKISDRDERRDILGTNRDKNEYSRHKRRSSPDRRRLRDYHEDSYKKAEGKHRVLVSPPKDRSHDHRRPRERRSSRDRHYGDRSRSRHRKRAAKHKLTYSDEPSSKRARNDSNNRQTERIIDKELSKPVQHIAEIVDWPGKNTQNVNERVTEKQPIQERFLEKRPSEGRGIEMRPIEDIVMEKRYIQDRFMEKRPIEERTLEKRPMEERFMEKRPIPERVVEKRPRTSQAADDRVTTLVAENLHEDSCQSPDHTFGEAVHVPREIKLIASCKLDDPRLKSSKYVKTDGENIYTTVGRNIDLKRASWNIPRVAIPEALRIPPQDPVNIVKELHQTPNFIDKLKKHVYVDIENPVSNLSMSMESGEIVSESDTTPDIGGIPNDSKTKINLQEQVTNSHDNHLKHKASDKANNFGGRSPHLTSESTREPDQNLSKSGIQNVDDAQKSLAKSYKIPKINKTENRISTSTEEAIRDVLRESCTTNDKSNERHSPKKTNEPTDKSLSSSKESLDPSKPKIILKLSELKNYRYGKLLPSEISQLANDLELSDDSNEFMKVTKRNSKGKKTHSHDQKTNTKDIKKFEVVENNSKFFNDHDLDYKKQKIKKKTDKLKDSKSKKKTDKLKDSKSKEVRDNKAQEKVDTIAKIENNKETAILERQAKFNELFGDSASTASSLITPEDLDVRPQTYSEPVEPMFEDAQDADDINVNKIVQDQTKPTKCVTENTSAENNMENMTIINNEVARETQEIDKCLRITDDKLEKLGDVKAIYENLFTGDDDTKDTEVVKTVILATGLQPQNAEHLVTDNSDHSNTNNIVPQGLSSLGTPLHALATSTPYKPLAAFDAYKTPQKPLPVNNVLEEARTEESSCNSSETAAEKTDASSATQMSARDVEQSVSRGEEVPDVRIFVRRRKRAGKKSKP